MVVEEYGQPEEVAAAYKEIENRIRPALSPSLSQPKRNIVSAFFGVITEPRAWGALLYMLLSLVTGIVYFTWVVTGLSLSAGLLVLIIGLPFIGLFLLSVRGIALVEGRIVEALLGEPMPRRPLFIDKDLNLWKRFKVLVADGRTWLAMVYMALQLPLGIIYFTLFVTLLSVSLSFIATPVLRLIFGPLSIENQHGLITSVILPSPDYWIPILVVASVVCVAAVVILQSPPLTRLVLAIVGKLPAGDKVAPKVEEMLRASRALLGFRALVIGLVLATGAWFCECAGYWLAFRGFGVQDFELGLATFGYSISTLAGVISPGGIGVTDAGLIEIAEQLRGVSPAISTAASFIVRVCTLWFAVGLGAIALLRFRGLVDVDVETVKGDTTGQDTTEQETEPNG